MYCYQKHFNYLQLSPGGWDKKCIVYKYNSFVYMFCSEFLVIYVIRFIGNPKPLILLKLVLLKRVCDFLHRAQAHRLSFLYHVSLIIICIFLPWYIFHAVCVTLI